MAGNRDWSRSEVEACVDDYLQMLTFQLNGQSFRKKNHLNSLVPKLNDRTEKAVRLKHNNITAVLAELNYPQLSGYGPMYHYQDLLREVVAARVAESPALQAAAQDAVTRPAVPPDVTGTDSPWEAAPAMKELPPRRAPGFSAAQRDYLAQEAQNRSLGKAGELYVVELEKRRLRDAGQQELCGRAEHVAATQGDGLGFDVLSFEDDGRERLIEVKTTAFSKLTPFYVTQNEIARSEASDDTFQLYRVFAFRDAPRLFSLPGRIADNCHLDAATYLARVG